MKYLTLLLALILLSALSSAQWIQQNSGTSEHLNDVIMLNKQTAIVAGNNGIILKSESNGTNWQQKFYQPGLQWNAVAFKDSMNGIVVGNNQRMATTNDAGESWTLSDSSGNRHFLSVTYMAASRIYIGDDMGKVMYSDNDGSTWNEILFGSNPINSIFFTETAYLYHSGYVVTPWQIYETNDSGLSWNSLSVPITIWGEMKQGEYTPNGEIAYAIGMDGQLWTEPVILRKTSTDSTWQKYNFSPSFYFAGLNDVSVPTKQTAYTCGLYGKVFSTKNNGSSWYPDSTNVTKGLSAIDFFDDSTGFTVGESGTILYTSNGGVTGIDGEGNNPPQKFILFQNFPNPFNTETTIRYYLPKPAKVNLAVYDLTGKKIKTLVNLKNSSGEQLIKYNAADLASGVYYCILKIHNQFINSIKFVLLK